MTAASRDFSNPSFKRDIYKKKKNFGDLTTHLHTRMLMIFTSLTCIRIFQIWNMVQCPGG